MGFSLNCGVPILKGARQNSVSDRGLAIHGCIARCRNSAPRLPLRKVTFQKCLRKLLISIEMLRNCCSNPKWRICICEATLTANANESIVATPPSKHSRLSASGHAASSKMVFPNHALVRHFIELVLAWNNKTRSPFSRSSPR